MNYLSYMKSLFLLDRSGGSLHRKLWLVMFSILIFSSLSTFAQDEPDDINGANLQLWLRADQGVTKDVSDNVTDWNDMSGQDNHFSVPSSGREPKWVDNQINTHSVIRFDGSNDILEGVTSAKVFGATPSEGEVIIVFHQSGHEGSNHQRMFNAPIQNNSASSFLLVALDAEHIADYNEGSMNTILRDNGNWGNIGQTGLISTTGSDYYAWRFGYDGTELHGYWNGSLLGTDNSGVNYNGKDGAGEICIGGRIHLHDLNFQGDIAEVIVYDAKLTQEQAVKLDIYLNSRYGDSVMPYPYTSLTHREDMIKIGVYADGTDYATPNEGNGGALYLADNSPLEANEWVYAGHSGTTHSITSNDITGYDRWDRDYYIERVASTVKDAGSIDVQLSFDLNEAGFGDANVSGRTISDYVLLYRAGTSGDFSVVNTSGTSFTNTNTRVTFDLDDADFTSGYYTLGLPEEYGESPFTINSANLKLWLRADKGITLDGSGNVTTWEDQSNAGNDFEQTGSSGKRPFFNVNAIEGLPALSFDHTSSDFMRSVKGTNDLFGTTPNEAEVVIVFRKTANTGDHQRIFSTHRSSGSGSFFLMMLDATHVASPEDRHTNIIVNSDGSNWGNIEVADIMSTDITDTYYWRAGFSANTNNLYSYWNGEFQQSVSTNIYDYAGAATGKPLLGTSVGENIAFFSGDIAEVIVYDKSLSPTESIELENYLNHRYGSMVSPYPYSSLTYREDIIKIGKYADGSLYKEEAGSANAALYIKEPAADLSSDEWVYAGHNGVEHKITQANVTAYSRWNRDYYVERVFENVQDAGTTNLEISFDFNDAGFGAADAGGRRVASDYVLLYRANTSDDFSVVTTSGTSFTDSNQRVTFNLSDANFVSGYYTVGLPQQKVWYSYTTGNWSDPNVWTLDGSVAPLLVNPDNSIPDVGDQVVITSGRTIIVNENNISLFSVEVVGKLDLANSTGNDFGTIDGKGIILMSGDAGGNDNFPAGITTGSNGFANVNNGGILEIIGSGVVLDESHTFNHVNINLDNTTDKVTLLKDFVINGDLTVEKGIFQINDDTETTAINIDLYGDMTIESEAQMSVGTADVRHEFNFYGDFRNMGLAKFSQRITQVVGSEATDGIIDANFVSDNQDQRIDCENNTYFYRIEADKGIDDTYILYLETASKAFFNLTGPTNYSYNFETDPLNDNTLAIYNGTVRLGTDVDIELISVGSNYSIPPTSRLWVAGGTAQTTTGAIVPYGVLEISAGTIIGTGQHGIVTRQSGVFKVDGGTVTTCSFRTSAYGSQHVGGYLQSGGSVVVDGSLNSFNSDYYVFSLTYEGNVFNMSGGTLTVKGAISDKDNTGNDSGKVHGGLMFINSDIANQNVTGGTVVFESSNSRNHRVTSRAPFYNVNIRNTSSSTTAKVILEGGTSGNDAYSNGDSSWRTLPTQDLVVLNDLTIETGTTRTQTLDGNDNVYGGYLDLCPNNADCGNLEVGRNLTIEDSGVLDVWAWDGNDNDNCNDGSATVTFNSSSDGVFYIGDITTYTNHLIEYRDTDGDYYSGTPFLGKKECISHWQLPLYNWIIDKPNATLSLGTKSPGKGPQASNSQKEAGFKLSNGGKNTTDRTSRLIEVTNQMYLLNGTLSQVDPNYTVVAVDGDGDGILDEGGNDDKYGVVGDVVGYSVEIRGAEFINHGNFFVYEDGVTPKEGAIEWNIGPGNETVNTIDGASFGNIFIEGGRSKPIYITSNISVGRMEFANGILDIDKYNVKIDVLEYKIVNWTTALADGQRVMDEANYIRMAGNASDGGLSVKIPNVISDVDDINALERINLNSIKDNSREYYLNDLIWLPIGTKASGTDKYTPALCYLHNHGQNLNGDEYLTIRVVDKELQTSELNVNDDNDGVLSYYWNVGVEGYAGGDEPTVSWLFQYDDSDVELGANKTEEHFVAGKVLDSGDYTRSTDGDVTSVRDAGANDNEGSILGSNPDNIILFNGMTGANDDIDNVLGSDADNQVLDDDDIDDAWADAFPGTGIKLENANYTAGVAERFSGEPTIYYVRSDGDWTSNSTWSLTRGGSVASSYPKAGDIAVIRRTKVGYSGLVTVKSKVEAAVVVYDDENGFSSGCPRVIFESDNSYAAYNSEFGEVKVADTHESGSTPNSSHGQVMQFKIEDGYTSNFPIGDFGNVFSHLNTLVIWGWDGASNNADVTLPSSVTEYPLLWFEGGNNSRRMRFPNDTDITVNSKTVIPFECILVAGENSTLTFKHDLILGSSCCGPYGKFLFPGAASLPTTVIVERNITVKGSDSQSLLGIESASSGVQIHKLIAKGNISIDSSGGDLNLGDGDSSKSNVELELQGDGTHNFTNNDDSGSSATLYKIIMNKGTGVTNTFSFNNNISLPDIGVTNQQPVEIVNGMLILDDASIDITLANAATGDFYLPNTNNEDASSGSGGLQINAGSVDIVGDDTGMVLDGILKLNGSDASFTLGGNGDNGNNFIEYSASAQAEINITGGALTVGGPLRRTTNNTEGILRYTQTGGDVIIANEKGDAEPTRGVFEITNAESSFTHTGGSLTIVNSNGSTTVPSVLIDPETYNLSGSTLTFANSSGDDNMGLLTTVTLKNIQLAGTGINNPTVKLYSSPLTLTGNLNIGTAGRGDIFDANGLDVTFTGGNLVNEGSYISGGNVTNQQLTTFSSGVAQSIDGSGVFSFYNLVKGLQNNTLTISQDITVNNELNILGGVLATGSQAVNVLGDVLNDGVHTADVLTNTLYGIIMSGSATQKLERSTAGQSIFGVLAVNNPEGVLIEDETYFDFEVTNKLILEQGVLDISSNLFVIGEDAVIENEYGESGIDAFSKQNMVQTNSSFTDYGLRKKFNTATATDFTWPVGMLDYTPVQLETSQLIDRAVGGIAPYITVRPANEVHPTVNNHNNTGTNTPGTLNDRNNVLQYHWLIKAEGIANDGFTGSLKMRYLDSDVVFEDAGDAVATVSFTEANYAGARLLYGGTQWDKAFGADSFDEANNMLVFDNTVFDGVGDSKITGDYTAGLLVDDAGSALDIGAVPNTIPTYTTAQSGVFNDNSTWDLNDVPVGAIVRVKAGHELTISSPNSRIYRTIIEEGATLTIDENAINTRVGIVEGTGTLKISSSTPGKSPQIPAGYYASFFATDCSGGGLEYTGTADYSVLAGVPRIKRVIFSGSGERQMSNGDLTVCENFVIRDNAQFKNDFDKTVVVKGHILKSDNAVVDFGKGTVIMEGTSKQFIAGDFTGDEAFHELVIDNTAVIPTQNVVSIYDQFDDLRAMGLVDKYGLGTEVSGDVHIGDTLRLNNGRLRAHKGGLVGSQLKILFNAGVTEGHINSYVDGPLTRVLDNDVNGEYNFPVGNRERFGKIDVIHPTFETVGGKSKLDWTAVYINEHPEQNSDGYGKFLRQAPQFTNPESMTHTGISDNEHWIVEADHSHDNALQVTSRIRLYWDSESKVDLIGANTAEDLRVMSYGSDAWSEVGSKSPNKSGDNYADGGSLESSDIVSYSVTNLTFGGLDLDAEVLPVELVSFVANKSGSHVVLEWETASEQNNSHFDIEYSTDGKSFTTIGTIDGAGNSTHRIGYSFVDKEATVGFNYYRLKQVDFDGAYEFSEIRAVEIDSIEETVALDAPKLVIYPNPNVGGILKLVSTGWDNASTLRLELVDMSGRTVQYYQEKATETGGVQSQIQLPRGMGSGLYIIKLIGQNQVLTQKLLVK